VYRITLQSVACDQTIISPELIGQWISNQQPSSHSALPLGGGESLSADPSALGKPSQSNATRLAVPQTIRGTLASSEEQWFQFVAQKGGSVTVTCHPIPSGIAAMPEILLVDTDGKPLAECKSTDGAGRDCRLVWKAVTDGQVQVRLRNAARGGPLRTMPYELTLCQASPDFELSVKQDSVNIVPGGRSELAVAVTRTVMDGPIDIAVTGLPDGVRAEPAKIAANQDFAKLVLVADATARPCDTPIQIKGQVAIDTMTMERTAQAQHLGRDVTGASIGSPTTDQLFLTVQHKPVFRLYCNEAYQYAHRGTIYPYAMQVERLDGFNGEITIQLGDRQNRDLDGIEFREVIVPPGQTEVQLPIYLPETMHINTLSQSQIYAQAYARFIDQWGTPQSTLVVSEKRNMIRTLPTVAKLSAQQPTVRAMPGRPVSCILTLDRSSNFCGEVEVELVDPPAGFLAEKTRMADGESKVEMIVHTSARTERVHSPSLRFRASGELTPGVAVVSEASIELVVE
jgi:hypothetical protein